MKNTVEEVNSRLGDTEDCISQLGDKIVVITQLVQQKIFKNKKKREFKGPLGQ